MAKDRPRYHFKVMPLPETEDSRRTAKQARRSGSDVEEWLVAHHGIEPRFTVWGASLPFPVEVTLGRDKYGRLAVTGIRIDTAKEQTPITATGLRQVGRMVTDLLERIDNRAVGDEAWALLLGPLLDAAAVPFDGVAVRPGRRGYSPEKYREWALTYREAIAADEDHPYTWLARKWHYSESQARRRVQQARKLFPELFGEVDG